MSRQDWVRVQELSSGSLRFVAGWKKGDPTFSLPRRSMERRKWSSILSVLVLIFCWEDLLEQTQRGATRRSPL